MCVACDQQVDAASTAIGLQCAEARIRQQADRGHIPESTAPCGKTQVGQFFTRSIKHRVDPRLAILATKAVKEDVNVLVDVQRSKKPRIDRVVEDLDSPRA